MAGRVVPWRSWKDWQEVGGWLLSEEPQQQQRGLDRVAAWRVHRRLPLAVESSASLVEALRMDQGRRSGSKHMASWSGDAGGGSVSDYSLRLRMALPIIKLVNCVADSQQKGKNAVSVAMLAASAGLPRTLVDIRHEATHHELPSLPLLRLGVQQALGWLKDTYWGGQSAQLGAAWERLSGIVAALLDSCREGVEARGKAGAATAEGDGDDEEEEEEDASTSLVSPPGPASGVKYIAALARKRRRELVSSLRSSVPPAWCQYLADVLLDTGCLDPPPSVADVTAAAAAAAAGEAGAGGTRGLAAAQQQQQQQLLLQQLKVQQHSWLAAMKQLVKAYPNLAATVLLGAVRRLAEASQHADPDLAPCGAGAGPSLAHEQGQGQGHGWVQDAAEEQEHGSRRVAGQKGSRKRGSSASGGQAPEPSSAAPAPAAPPQLVGPSMAPGLGVWLWAPQDGAYGEGDAAAAWRRERLPAWERWALTLLPRPAPVPSPESTATGSRKRKAPSAAAALFSGETAQAQAQAAAQRERERQGKDRGPGEELLGLPSAQQLGQLIEALCPGLGVAHGGQVSGGAADGGHGDGAERGRVGPGVVRVLERVCGLLEAEAAAAAAASKGKAGRGGVQGQRQARGLRALTAALGLRQAALLKLAQLAPALVPVSGNAGSGSGPASVDATAGAGPGPARAGARTAPVVTTAAAATTAAEQPQLEASQRALEAARQMQAQVLLKLAGGKRAVGQAVAAAADADAAAPVQRKCADPVTVECDAGPHGEGGCEEGNAVGAGAAGAGKRARWQRLEGPWRPCAIGQLPCSFLPAGRPCPLDAPAPLRSPDANSAQDQPLQARLGEDAAPAEPMLGTGAVAAGPWNAAASLGAGPLNAGGESSADGKAGGEGIPDYFAQFDQQMEEAEDYGEDELGGGCSDGEDGGAAGAWQGNQMEQLQQLAGQVRLLV